MFYATLDNDGAHIDENAHIAKFKTREEAESYLLESFDPAEFSIEIEAGSFGDCWIKSSEAPRIGDAILAPFTFNQIYVQRPGQHPGGKKFWLTPRADILIAIVSPL